MGGVIEHKSWNLVSMAMQVSRWFILPALIFCATQAVNAAETKANVPGGPGKNVSRSRIRISDPIEIEIKEPASAAPDFNSIYTVGEDGTLRIPFLPSGLQVAGLPYDQLPGRIEAALRDAGVFEKVSFAAGMNERSSCEPPSFYAGGAVKGGGAQVPFKRDQPKRLTEAVKAAGGFALSADLQHVKLTRGTQERVLDLSAGGQGLRENPVIQSGDTIFVPEIEALKEKRIQTEKEEEDRRLAQQRRMEKEKDQKKREAHRFAAGNIFRVNITGTQVAGSLVEATVVVAMDGTVKLPDVKTPVQAALCSVDELERRIAAASPHMSILEAPKAVIHLWAEDHKPFPVVAVSGEGIEGGARAVDIEGGRLFDAILKAGGFSANADARHVKLIRCGVEEIWNLESPKRPSFYQPLLQPGDRIEIGKK